MFNFFQYSGQFLLDQFALRDVAACGCASVDFTISALPHAQGGMNILSDYLFGDESDPKGVFVWECNGILAGIEVYGLAADAPKSLPSIESLRPYGPELV